MNTIGLTCTSTEFPEHGRSFKRFSTMPQARLKPFSRTLLIIMQLSFFCQIHFKQIVWFSNIVVMAPLYLPRQIIVQDEDISIYLI